jgi:hypothetical protein
MMQVCYQSYHVATNAGSTGKAPYYVRFCCPFYFIRLSLAQLPVLPDFLRSSGSGTGSTQPREYN